MAYRKLKEKVKCFQRENRTPAAKQILFDNDLFATGCRRVFVNKKYHNQDLPFGEERNFVHEYLYYHCLAAENYYGRTNNRDGAVKLQSYGTIKR